MYLNKIKVGPLRSASGSQEAIDCIGYWKSLLQGSPESTWNLCLQPASLIVHQYSQGNSKNRNTKHRHMQQTMGFHFQFLKIQCRTYKQINTIQYCAMTKRFQQATEIQADHMGTTLHMKFARELLISQESFLGHLLQPIPRYVRQVVCYLQTEVNKVWFRRTSNYQHSEGLLDTNNQNDIKPPPNMEVKFTAVHADGTTE